MNQISTKKQNFYISGLMYDRLIDSRFVHIMASEGQQGIQLETNKKF